MTKLPPTKNDGSPAAEAEQPRSAYAWRGEANRNHRKRWSLADLGLIPALIFMPLAVWYIFLRPWPFAERVKAPESAPVVQSAPAPEAPAKEDLPPGS